MANFQLVRIFHGSYTVESFESSASGTYLADLLASSPISVNVEKKISAGDMHVLFAFDSQNDQDAFLAHARSGDTNPDVVGVMAADHSAF